MQRILHDWIIYWFICQRKFSWLTKIIKIVATKWRILRLKCTKFDFGWGSAPDHAGGAYSIPPDPLAGFEGSGVGTYLSGTARAVPLLKVGRLVMRFAVPLFGHRPVLLNGKDFWLWTSNNYNIYIFAIDQFPIIFGTCVLIPLWHAYALEEDYLVNDSLIL